MLKKFSAPSASGVAMENLEGRTLLATVGGLDSFNLGKGDFIVSVSAAQANTGTSSVQGFVDYLKVKGFKWIAVKAGDGNNFTSQFTSDLVTRVHTAGMKIFGYQSVYGGQTSSSGGVPTSQSGEKSNMDKIMAVGADGLILDAGAAWEKVSSANTVASGYGSYFKGKYSSKLLGFDTFAYAGAHPNFPYLGFAKHADVAMPQMFWKTLTSTPAQIVKDVDTQWKALYNGFAEDGNSDSIKPIVPIGQGSDVSTANPTPGTEITEFFNTLRNDVDPASPFGYNGVAFWNAQVHTPGIWLAITNGAIGGPTGTISGSVFNDADGDQVRDVGESGIAGRIVYDDTNHDGARQLYEPFAKTDSAGKYTLSYMAGRTHQIKQVVPGGLRQSVPAGTGALKVTMTNGQKVADVAFGTTNYALITGTVYNDLNADGAKVSTEPVLAGRTVFIDANQNGVLDTGELSAITDSKGTYSISAPAGTYQLREIPPDGFRITSPVSVFYTFSVAAGETTLKFFGNTSNVLISGTVFKDLNSDGIKGAGEGGLAGWRVWVDADGDGVFDTNEVNVLTDATGKYRINSIGGGTWRIQVAIPAGWAATIPGSAARKITIASGGTTSNKNFGVRQNT